MVISPNDKFGSLRPQFTCEVSIGSHKRTVWLCDCGKTSDAQISAVLTGHTTSCGKCNHFDVSHWQNTKYGKLRMKSPEPCYGGSRKKRDWICDCGNETSASTLGVFRGHTTSCGKCNILHAPYWLDTKYGSLRMKEPGSHVPGSGKKVSWSCDCGKVAITSIYAVTSGNTTSCGRCNTPDPVKIPKPKFNMFDIHVSSLDISLDVDIPLDSETSVDSETGVDSETSVDSIKEITDFINSLSISVLSNYQVNGYQYDISILSSKLLIEYNELNCHSLAESKKHDIAKHSNAVDSGWDFLSIFEDEWKLNRDKVQSLLSNKLRVTKPKALRPSQCETRKISNKLADPLYDEYHYIGAGKAPINYGVYYQDLLIGCCSFKRPTRQTIAHPWELIRMVSDSKYRVHGMWSKIIKQFCREYDPASIISFSDNRLFNGGVYSKMGFVYDGDVRPDYYWHRDGHRYHKSGLRKPDGYKDGTESFLRESQGYRKIWDLGKKRWIYKP